MHHFSEAAKAIGSPATGQKLKAGLQSPRTALCRAPCGLSKLSKRKRKLKRQLARMLKRSEANAEMHVTASPPLAACNTHCHAVDCGELLDVPDLTDARRRRRRRRRAGRAIDVLPANSCDSQCLPRKLIKWSPRAANVARRCLINWISATANYLSTFACQLRNRQRGVAYERHTLLLLYAFHIQLHDYNSRLTFTVSRHSLTPMGLLLSSQR